MYFKEQQDKWKFIGLFHIILRNPEFIAPYYRFYQQQFSQENFGDEEADFIKALKDKSYKKIYDYLINASFLHYYLAETKKPVAGLPKNNFANALKKLENLNYELDLPLRSKEFIDLGFLATHVFLVLTNYGELALKDSKNAQKAADFIEATFDKVRYQLGYLDLLAEYIQCLKMLPSTSPERILSMEKILFDLQRYDGSWGIEEDFSSDPYTAFHATWAVLTALNH